MTEISFAEKKLVLYNRVLIVTELIASRTQCINIPRRNIKHVVLLVTVRFVLLAEKEEKETYSASIQN